MADFLEVIVFFLGLIAIPLYVTCLGEFRTFPFFVHTQKNEITMAHIMRFISVITTGISASYGLALFGHMIGFGGLETMFTQQRQLFFLAFGFVAVAFTIYSKRLDNLIYKEIQEYSNFQDEQAKVARQRIRDQDLIRKELTRTTEEKAERATNEERRLEKIIQKKYRAEQKLEEVEQKLSLATKRLKEADKANQKTVVVINMTTQRIKETEKEIARLEGEATVLNKKLTTLKKSLRDSLSVLSPLLEESESKEKKLDRTSKEFQKVTKRIREAKGTIQTLSKEIKKAQQQTDAAEKELKNLERDSPESERKLTLVQRRLESLSKQKNDLQEVINTRDIQRLSAKEEIIAIRLLEKEIEKSLEDTQPSQGGKVFES